jgi:hypothetical protein
MATVPLSGTDIRLLSGVPFANDYKHTRWFDTLTDQTNYFLSKPVVHHMTQANFQRMEGYYFIAVNKSIDELWGTNYLMFNNTSKGNGWWYAFVTKLEYVQKNTTYVHFQIDVFQTWKFYMNFKPSFVVREHCPLWNADGTPVINTVDEGLNYGTEYDTVSVIQYQPNDGYKWLVIVTKTPIHNGGAGNVVTPLVVGTPQPLSVYMVPFKDNNTVPRIYVEASQRGIVISKPTDVLRNLYMDTDSVNNVVSLYVTDYTGIPVNIEYGSPDVFTFPDNGNVVVPAQISDGSGDSTKFFNCIYVQEIPNFKPINWTMGAKYTGYNTVKESKLLMYPYTQVILDDFKGNRVTYKNEYINSPNLNLIVKGSCGLSNKTSYGVKEYNFNANGLQDNMSDEFALINSEPNDIPIIADLLSAYIQGHRNTIQNQKNQIYLNAGTNLGSSVISTLASAWSGATAGMTVGSMGGPYGAGAGAVAGGVVGTAQGIVSGIKGGANGVLQIQAIESQMHDISNTPPSIGKMGSNTSYTLGNQYNGVYVIKKQIKAEYIKKLEDFFNMFGYKKNEVKLPNFHTRKYWNYVQTQNCVITANFNNDDLQELKSVFDSGITLWHTDDVGNYSLTNEVI